MSEIQINLKKLEEQISQLRVLNENLKASVTFSKCWNKAFTLMDRHILL